MPKNIDNIILRLFVWKTRGAPRPTAATVASSVLAYVELTLRELGGLAGLATACAAAIGLPARVANKLHEMMRDAVFQVVAVLSPTGSAERRQCQTVGCLAAAESGV